jgi:hypothetical protein
MDTKRISIEFVGGSITVAQDCDERISIVVSRGLVDRCVILTDECLDLSDLCQVGRPSEKDEAREGWSHGETILKQVPLPDGPKIEYPDGPAWYNKVCQSAMDCEECAEHCGKD